MKKYEDLTSDEKDFVIEDLVNYMIDLEKENTRLKDFLKSKNINVDDILYPKDRQIREKESKKY